MILADKITEERKKNGWSQEELAEQLGVSRQAVSKWESAGSVPDLQKIIQMANLFGVSTDYLLKEELEPKERYAGIDSNSELERPLRRVSMEEANEYLNVRKQAAPIIANATALCIMSPVLVVLLGAFHEGNLFHITEAIVGGVGCTALFGLIAVAVFMFITTGMKMSHSEHLEKEMFETEYGVTGMVKEKSRAYENSKKEKKAKGKLDALSGAYWSLATAIYLGWSFWTMRWDITWILWPVAGVLFAAVLGIVRAVMRVDE